MIPNKEKERWNYFSVKKISALLHKKTLKHKGNFYCLNCLNSFRTENKFKPHEKVCKSKDFCGIEMPTEKKNILFFKQYMKSDKMSHINHAGIESLIRKINGCANNAEKIFNNKKMVIIFLVDI